MSNCEDDFIGGIWVEIPISILPVIILQVLWLCHTVRTEYIVHKTMHPNKSYKFQRILHLSLQIIGLCWTISDVFCFIIDPHTLILRNNIGCYIVAYIPKVVPGVYYGLYLYQILLRLESSFRDSCLAISKRTIIIFKVLIIPILTGPIWFLILNRGETACVRGWKAHDVTSWYERPEPYKFAYCTVKTNFGAALFLIFVVLFLGFINIAFGVIFAMKLKVLLSANTDNRLKALIVKNSILTVTGSISTVSSYLIWIILTFGTGLYIDLLVNCLVIGLMFKYNSKLYKRLCKCCIVMCFLKCDKSKSKMKEEDVARYVNGDHTFMSQNTWTLDRVASITTDNSHKTTQIDSQSRPEKSPEAITI
eukprot:314305_1